MNTQFKIERKTSILERVGFSRSTLHTRIKQGLFPTPISLGDRAVGWVVSEVDACLAAMISGQSKEDIQALVASLIEQRTHALAVR